MIDDHWGPTLPNSTVILKTTGETVTQVWCATRAGRTLSCQVRALADGPGWEVIMKTGLEPTPPPHWLVRWLHGRRHRVVDCRRASHTPLVMRRCADAVTAHFVTESLRQEYVSAGWVEC